MQKYIYWQDDLMFLGYLEDYLDYWTRQNHRRTVGENLIDIYKDLTGGTIPSYSDQQ